MLTHVALLLVAVSAKASSALPTHHHAAAGYALYVDGRQAGAVTQASAAAAGTPATGGNPAQIPDGIVLCARTDLDPGR